MSRVLVTGAAGAIGTALVASLQDSDHEVVAVDRKRSVLPDHPGVSVCDLRTDDELPSADVIVHLAAHSQVQPMIDNPSLGVENIAMTQRVLEHAVEEDATVVLASSREVYGSAIRPVEDDVGVEAPNPYAASKISTESFGSAYESCFDIDVIRLRFSNVYGPYDCNPRVVPIFVTRGLQRENLVVYGDGKVLDFVYVGDVTDAIERTIERREALAGEAITVGSGRGTQLTELAERIVNLVDQPVDYSVERNRTGDTEEFVADIERARSLLDFHPRSLESGLADTVEWYRNHEVARQKITSALS